MEKTNGIIELMAKNKEAIGGSEVMVGVQIREVNVGTGTGGDIEKGAA